jgi:hypothetical protein
MNSVDSLAALEMGVTRLKFNPQVSARFCWLDKTFFSYYRDEITIWSRLLVKEIFELGNHKEMDEKFQ